MMSSNGPHDTCRRREARLLRLAARNRTLVEELTHRFSNALMILAAVTRSRANVAREDEARAALMALHHQILAVAAIQQVLQPPADGRDRIVVRDYLTRLCDDLKALTAGSERQIAIRVRCGPTVARAEHAFRIGILVTELIINAAKHAFPDQRHDCRVSINYSATPPRWRLIVSDNGIGAAAAAAASREPQLGATILATLAKQMGAEVRVETRNGRRTIIRCPGTIRLSRRSVPSRSRARRVPASPAVALAA